MSDVTSHETTNGGAQRNGSDRRFMLKASLATFAALGATSITSNSVSAATGPLMDFDILNFALNLEYLEAEFYLRAVTGQGLTQNETTGRGTKGAVTGGSQVPFVTTAVQQYAAEIAADERAHVNFLRTAIGDKAVAEPDIDLKESFNVLARAAGIGDSFDPFASEENFLIGAFIFEDVGVSAYHGAAPALQSKDYLDAAAGILAVEAYHSGIIRTLLVQGGTALTGPANKISDLRDALDGNPANQDQGPMKLGVPNLVAADSNGIAFSRTTDEVLGIVYAGGAANNFGFFPSRVNGRIK